MPKFKIARNITKHKKNRVVCLYKNALNTLKNRGVYGKIKYEEYEVEEDTERQRDRS